MRILILAETGFLTDICLKQSQHSEYLYDQAAFGNLSIAVPEYAFAETDGSLLLIPLLFFLIKLFLLGKEKVWLHRRLKARQQKLQEIVSFANELQRSSNLQSYAQHLKEILTTLRNLTENSVLLVKADLADLRRVCHSIAPTFEILNRGKLRCLSSTPPPDEVDCLIFESIKSYIQEHSQKYDLMLFLCHDRVHFDHPEVHQELAAIGAQIVFSSSECLPAHSRKLASIGNGTGLL